MCKAARGRLRRSEYAIPPSRRLEGGYNACMGTFEVRPRETILCQKSAVSSVSSSVCTTTTMHRPISMCVTAARRRLISIDRLTVLEGHLSPRVMGLVIEWAALRRTELKQDWERARQELPLERIDPLEP